MADLAVLTGSRVTLRAPTLGRARVLERGGLPLEGRLVRYGMIPNLSAEPQDCLRFAKAVR